MSVTRRDFLKLSGTVAAGAVIGGGITTLTGCSPSSKKTKGSKKHLTVCPFCPLGCGLRVYVRKGKPVHLDGDPDHPVNRGTLCAKAYLLLSMDEPGVRLDLVRYRAAGANDWQTLSWERALDMIADRFKATRDAAFIQEDNGVAVNRVESIAGIAGSSLTNEEAYLFNKFLRIAGCVSVGTESLLRGGSSAEALSASFGLPSQTNPWTDIRNAGSVLVLGANPARSMPVAMRHILDARNAGGALVVADPVITETSSVSDCLCRIRPGTDAAFLLGLINHAISTNSVSRDYLVEYTDAPCVLKSDFDYDIAKALFSGWDGAKKRYDTSTWEYERDERGNPRRDEELRNLRTVYQALKRVSSRYTSSYVSQVTGCSEESFMRAADLILSGVSSGKTCAVIIGSGVEGHAAAAQTVRAASVLLMLTGSIGVSGGGLFLASGRANSRGVDDQIPSWTMMPGEIPLPKNSDEARELDPAGYIRNNAPVSNDTMSVNFRQFFKNYSTSQLKAFFGDYASKETRFGFDLLPKTGAAQPFHSRFSSGSLKGLILLGCDPFGGSADAASLSRLEWLVVSDSMNSASAGFWQGPSSSQIRTEVFLLPARTLAEKSGTVTSSSRWVSYRDGIPCAAAEAKSELWMIDALFRRIAARYVSGGIFPEPFLRANWKYGDADDESVRREIGGVKLPSGKPLSSVSGVAADGSTACGNICYCGMNDDDAVLERNGTSSKNDLYTEWGWASPSNVRVLYNRAGVDRKGVPWNGRRAIVSLEKKRSGLDTAHGQGSAEGRNPFIMTRERLGRIFAPQVSLGPLPDHIEPVSSGFQPGRAGATGTSALVAVHAGVKLIPVWRNIPGSAEMFPEGYCEMSQSFAAARSISAGDTVTVRSVSGSGTFTALVTQRLSPLDCGGTAVDVIALCGRETSKILPPAGSSDDQYIAVDVTAEKRGSR